MQNVRAVEFVHTNTTAGDFYSIHENELPNLNYITVNYYQTNEILQDNTYLVTVRFDYINTNTSNVIIYLDTPESFRIVNLGTQDVSASTSLGQLQFENTSSGGDTRITLNMNQIPIGTQDVFNLQYSYKGFYNATSEGGFDKFQGREIVAKSVNYYEFIVKLHKRTNGLDFWNSLELGEIKPHPDSIFQTKDDVEIIFHSDKNSNLKMPYVVPVEVNYKYSVNYSAVVTGIIVFLFSTFSFILVETFFGEKMRGIKETFKNARKRYQVLIIILIPLIFILLILATIWLGDVSI